MKATIKLATSQKEREKGFPVWVELFNKPQGRKRKTICYSKIEFWDSENNRPFRQHPEYNRIIGTVLSYGSKIAQVNYGNFSYDAAIELIFRKEDENTPVTTGFISFFDVRIAEKKAKGQPFQSYVNVKRVVEGFVGTTDIDFKELTYEWVNSFVLYKLRDKCKAGGVASYLKTMSAVFNQAKLRTSLNVKQDNPFKPHISIPAAKPILQIEKEDLLRITSFEPHKFTNSSSKDKMKRAVDLFIFQFLIGGHDYVDIALLKWSDIKKGRIIFQRYKNRNKKNGGPVVDSYIFPEALRIINKYGTKDEERIFSFIPSPERDYYHYNQYRGNVNRTLKKISELSKLKVVLKSKSTRYIFRTYAGELLVHDLIVHKIMGHAPKGISFNYLGKISHKVIDESHKKVIDFLFVN